MIDIHDTIALASAVERFKKPSSVLLDTFFPVIPEVSVSTWVQVDSKKGNRRLAPVIVRGAKGVNMARSDFDTKMYKAPLIAPAFTLDPEKISQRGFGEGIYSTVSPAERATRQQALDLAELQAMILNRKNQMAAEILTTGKCEIKGYADDGKTVIADTIDYGWDQKITPSTTWDQAGADVFHDLQNASELVQENAGLVPTIAIVGKNVADYILDNDKMMKMLSIPSVDNLKMASIEPHYLTPQVQYVGKIQALNLEIYRNVETYINDEGKVTPFVPVDDVIVGVPGRGRQLHAAVTLLNKDHTGYDTYAAQYVPYYAGNEYDQELKLTMYSRCVLAPEFVDDWAVIHTKGE
jgi:hypothetical protein